MWKLVPSDDSFQPAIFDIAVDPKNAEHLWVGTTEGLFESADGGITRRQIKLETPTQIWDPIPAWDISINPCGRTAGINRQNDHGKTCEFR